MKHLVVVDSSGYVVIPYVEDASGQRLLRDPAKGDAFVVLARCTTSESANAAKRLLDGPPPPCTECGGRGVEFRGKGLDTQHRICSRYKEPGHPSEENIRARIREVIGQNWPPSGRFA